MAGRFRVMRPGALFVIAACFLGSGVFRAVEWGPAVAQGISDMGQQQMDAAPMNEMGLCPPQLEPESLLLAIQERDAQLSDREQRLNDREQVLRVAALKIEEQMTELEDAEQRLSGTIALADEAAEKDVQRLTSVYENMKPKNAATIFETMDINFAAGFLMRMRPEAAAAVLSNLSSEAAYSVSVVMAGRNVGAPTE